MSKSRSFIITGAVYGVTGVLFGAMAAHALKPVLSENLMQSFQTGVKFQMYHALALLAIAPSLTYLKKSYLNLIYYFFTLGTLLFSGSIYVLCLAPTLGLSVSWIGPITPLGGVLLIAAWFLVVLAAIAKKED